MTDVGRHVVLDTYFRKKVILMRCLIGATAFSVAGEFTVETADELIGWAAGIEIGNLQFLPMEPELAEEVGEMCSGACITPSLLFCTFGEVCPCRDWKAALAEAQKAIDCARILSGKVGKPIVLASPSYLRALGDAERGLAGKGDDEKQVAFLRRIAEYLGDDDKVVVAVEAINRFESRGPNDPRDVLKLFVKAGVYGRFKLLFDTFHAWHLGTGEDPGDILLDVAEHVGLVHVSQPDRAWIHKGPAITQKVFRTLAFHPSLEDVPIVMEAFTRQSPEGFFHPLACNTLPDVTPQALFERGANWLEMECDAA